MLSGLIWTGGFWQTPPTPLPSPLVPVDANTAYVNKSGDDITWTPWDMSKPFLTIQAAFDAASFFPTVRVFDGIYTEDLDPTFWGTIILSNAKIIWNISGTSAIWIIGDRRGVDIVWTIKPSLIWNITANALFISDLELWDGQLLGWSLGKCRIYNTNINTSLTVFPSLTGFGMSEGWVVFDNCTITTTSTFITAVPAAFWFVSSLWIFRNCKFNVAWFASWLEDNWDFVFENWNTIVSSTHVFSGSSDGPGSGSSFDLSYCDIETSAGYIFDYDGASTIDVTAYKSIIKCAETENVRWVATPLNRVTLKSTSDLKKAWDITWVPVVNQIVNNDFIDANL